MDIRTRDWVKLTFGWLVLALGFSTWLTWVMFMRWDMEVLSIHRGFGASLLLALGGGWIVQVSSLTRPGSHSSRTAFPLFEEIGAAFTHPDRTDPGKRVIYQAISQALLWCNLFMFSVVALSELPTIVRLGMLPDRNWVWWILEVHRYANAVVPVFTLVTACVYPLAIPRRSAPSGRRSQWRFHLPHPLRFIH